MPSHRARNRFYREVPVVSGAAVGVLVVIATFGVWAYFVPSAANSFCTIGLYAEGASATSEPSPAYDEQAVLFDPEGGVSVASSIQVSTDVDGDGYGAAFLVNALSSAGYWYQVGVAYDWGWQSGYLPGFAFIYSIYAPGAASSSPTSICLERVSVQSTDSVELSIQLLNGTIRVSMAQPGPGVLSTAVFGTYGASSFEGTSRANSYGFFTGWMTEWRHAQPYYGPSATANYSLDPTQSTAYFAVGETDESNGVLVFGQSSSPEDLDCMCTQSFDYQGVSLTATASTFTSG
jgi:hypothetical protein